jgi:predicted metalloprotease with PDZ domain
VIRICGVYPRFSLGAFLFLHVAVLRAQVPPSAAESRGSAVRYTISLAQAANHLVRIGIELPGGTAQGDLQLPVWNALYQVRDFSQYLNWVKAANGAGEKLPIRKMNTSLWRLSGNEKGAQVEYEVFANDSGPYGAELNSQHAFFNLAELLMYEVDSRSAPVQLHFIDIPSGWKIATALAGSFEQGFTAVDYDHLVDSPVEIGNFQEVDFEQGGGHYRVVVDASRADYDMGKIVAEDRSIVEAATSWMRDRPFATYLFLYHFPHFAGGGGMEHAACTAIELPASLIGGSAQPLAAVSAHEFFHLWNVKRIRPQSLEPVDYTKAQPTTALWFSEGVTSTVENIILSRAGLLDPAHYLLRLAAEIRQFESRPAHLTQSAEESSLDAWFEKYAYYQAPERSISYYNKGELLGVVLDLAVREASDGASSLREVFEWMNQNYAEQGRTFPDSKGVEQAAEAVSHADLRSFFEKYVQGTDAIPWDQYFQTVGLKLLRQKLLIASPGFSATESFNKPPVVSAVSPDSGAAQAGLKAGDLILEINRRMTGTDFEQRLADLHPGDTVSLRIRHGESERQLYWKMESREEVDYQLRDTGTLTPQQRSRRTAWLRGESQSQSGGALR